VVEERRDLLIMYHHTCCTFVNCYQNHNNYEPVLTALIITSCREKERSLLVCHRITDGKWLTCQAECHILSWAADEIFMCISSDKF